MFFESEASVIVMEVQLTPKVRKRVAERTEAGKCLKCDCEVHRRGLCTKHYSQFRTALLERPKKERPAIEAKLIERGDVAKDRQGQRSVVNEFREFASSGVG